MRENNNNVCENNAICHCYNSKILFIIPNIGISNTMADYKDYCGYFYHLLLLITSLNKIPFSFVYDYCGIKLHKTT